MIVEVFLLSSFNCAYFYRMILHSVNDLLYSPQRIISLVPSQTELLHYLGLEKETVGITKFCVHPRQWFTTKTRVGGTKTISQSIINSLQPDLIIANKEENVKEQVEALAKDYNVWLTDVNDLDNALQMINDIGTLTNKTIEASRLAAAINHEFSGLKKLQTKSHKPQVAYLIWQKPYMTIGGDTFINDMLNKCGLHNAFINTVRYPEVTIDQLQTTNLKFVLLSSEPYPFKQKHIDELQKHLPETTIMLVDGEMFSWYGSRLLYAAPYFRQLISKIIQANAI